MTKLADELAEKFDNGKKLDLKEFEAMLQQNFEKRIR
jgi:hypothetical protein